MSKVYAATSLIGGITGSLDNINGSGLVDKDIAIVGVQGGNLMPYVLDADLGEAENSPLIIAPDNNAGSKRWKLVGIQPAFSHVRAETNAGQSIPDTTHTTVIFEDETEDVLDEYNNATGIFTATYTGWYMVSSSLLYTSSAWIITNFLQIGIEGSVTKRSGKTPIQASTTDIFGVDINTVVKLTATQTLYITTYHSRGAATLLDTNEVWNWLTIDRIA